MNEIHRDRRGMTLVELMVVTVLGSLVLATIYQVLVTNQRTYAVQNAQVRGQHSLRAGLEILASELREVSPADGDLVSMGANSIHIRASRGLGLVCQVLTGGQNPTVHVRRVGNYLKDDSARVFYENHPSRNADNDWRTALTQSIDSSGLLTCPLGSQVAQEIRLRGIRYGNRPDSFLAGAPIRTFVHYRYYLGDYNGETYLIQEDPDGVTAPLVGPLDPTNGVEFRYLDENGSVTTTAADVRQIRVTLRTAPRRSDNEGGSRQDDLDVLIYTRNAN